MADSNGFSAYSSLWPIKWVATAATFDLPAAHESMSYPKQIFAILCLFIAAACGGKKDANPSMERPWNGSPVGAQFQKFGEKKGERTVVLRLYNFGSEGALSYSFMLRYFDDAGAVLKVRPGTSFESDVDVQSVSGTKSDILAPKKEKEMTLDFGMNVPAKAVRAEILVTKVGGVDKDLAPVEIWSAPYSQSWPNRDAEEE